MPDPKHVRGTENDCYSRADPDEPLFTLLGRDRHGGALVALWAFMRRKEGEDPAVVADAEEAAEEMYARARSLGRPALTLDSLVTLCASLQHEREAERAEAARLASEAPKDPVGEGDWVTNAAGPFNGHVGRAEKVFAADHETIALRGLVNVVYGRAPSERRVTVAHRTLRHPTETELRSAGISS
jgi:hypothetical protein